MSYHLGVDLGTSYTAAAICRNGVLEMVSLGTRSLEIPTVVYLDTGGTLLIGEAAERRGATDPTRIAREYKRRLGDPAPILVAGTPFAAEALMGAVLRSVLAEVTARQGEPPAHVTLTRPANWGPYKQELFGHVPALADLGPSSTATEPEAAAVHFASTTRVTSGQVIAVYDLGGGTFDAAVLRKTDLGFTTLGTPEGIEHLGGADFDDAVFEYVRRALGPAFAELDPTDPAVRMAAARLRTECVLAKESLSRDTEATIPVALPGLQTEVRLTRQDFEELVRPSLMATVESLRRSVRSAGVSPDDVAATVLAGGSSRIPLAAELITGELQLPVAVGTHPKHTVALGAALLAARNAAQSPVEEPTGRFDHGMVAAASGPVPAITGGTGATVAGVTAGVTATGVTGSGAEAAKGTGPGDDPHPSDAASATGSGLFGMPNNTGVLENREGRRRRSLLLVGAIAAVAVVLAGVLIAIRPSRSTGGTPSAAGTGVTVAQTEPTDNGGPASTGPTEPTPTTGPTGTPGPTDSSEPTDTSPEVTISSTVPALIPAGAVCDGVDIAFLGTMIDPTEEDTDGTGDVLFPGAHGAAMYNAAQLAVDEFSAANPDCRVALQLFSTDNDGTVAKQRADEIAADSDIVGVVVGAFSGEVAAAGPELEAGGMTFMIPAAKQATLNKDGWNGFNRVIGVSAAQGSGVAEFLTGNEGAQRVLLLDDDGAYGKGIADLAEESLGDAMVAREKVDPGSPDLSQYKDYLIELDPDAIFFAGAPSVAGQVLASLRENGYSGTFVFSEGEAVPRLGVSDEVSEGAYMACSCAPGDIQEEFADNYSEAYGEPPPPFAPEAYDATVILLRGIADGAVTREDLVAYARGYTGDGITKPIAFEPDTGNIVGRPTFITQIADGVANAYEFEP